MKKLSALLCVAILAMICPQTISKANNENINTVNYSEKYYRPASDFVRKLTGKEITKQPEETISRAEFADLIVSVCNVDVVLDGDAEKKHKFSDVKQDNPYYSSIYVLRDIGAIAQNDIFEPDRAITISEAIKMLVVTAGLSIEAELLGGYPGGYISIADDLDIMDRISVTGELIYADAIIMMQNYMFAEMENTDGVWVYNEDGKYAIRHNLNAKTYLYYYYGYEYKSGVIDETRFNSYDINHTVSERDFLKIDGEGYAFKEITADMLGKNVTAIYSTDDEIDFLYENEKNEEITIMGENYIGILGNDFRYLDEKDKEKKYELNDAYVVIYNGRRVSRIEDYMLDDAHAEITLQSNDGKDGYEVIRIDSNIYGVIQTVDYVYNTFSIDEPQNMHIDLENNVLFDIYGTNGENIELLELLKDDVVAIKMSADKSLVEIKVLEKRISGKVTMISKDENILGIDGITYSVSKWFEEKYFGENSNLLSGMSVEVALTDDDLVVCMMSQSDKYRYGYIKGVFYNDPHDALVFKMFTDNGKFEVINVSDKLVLDGKTEKNADVVYNKLGGADLTPQLVKYVLNSDGKVSKLDTSKKYEDYVAENPGYMFGDPINENDSLLYYGSRPSGSSLYRSNLKGFVGFANISSSFIIVVPSDPDDEDKYKITTMDDLYSGASYEWKLYDLDDTGAAGAVQLVDISKDISERNYSSMIVEKIIYAIDENNEECYLLKGWCNGTFVEYTVTIDVVNEAVGDTQQRASGYNTDWISVGDIICIDIEGTRIEDLFIEFEYDEETRQHTFVGRHNVDNRYFTNISVEGNQSNQGFYGAAPVCYMQGYAYNKSYEHLMLGLTRENDNISDDIFDYPNLRLSGISNNIICFDRDIKKLIHIGFSQINTYKGSGNEADHLIIRNDEDRNNTIFVIR